MKLKGFGTVFATLIVSAALTGVSSPAEAGLSLRTGINVKPLVFFGDTSGTIGDLGWLGIDVAPGYSLGGILTLEAVITPMIPLSGPTKDFSMLIAPALRLDLKLLYARFAVPIQVTPVTALWFQAAAGMSFLGFGYLGLTVDFDTRATNFLVGAEAGVQF